MGRPIPSPTNHCLCCQLRVHLPLMSASVTTPFGCNHCLCSQLRCLSSSASGAASFGGATARGPLLFTLDYTKWHGPCIIWIYDVAVSFLCGLEAVVRACCFACDPRIRVRLTANLTFPGCQVENGMSPNILGLPSPLSCLLFSLVVSPVSPSPFFPCLLFSGLLPLCLSLLPLSFSPGCHVFLAVLQVHLQVVVRHRRQVPVRQPHPLLVHPLQVPLQQAVPQRVLPRQVAPHRAHLCPVLLLHPQAVAVVALVAALQRFPVYLQQIKQQF